MRNFDYEIRDICKKCKHYSGWADWELGVEYIRCNKYNAYCGECKHKCRKLKRELIDKIRMERSKRKMNSTTPTCEDEYKLCQYCPYGYVKYPDDVETVADTEGSGFDTYCTLGFDKE